MAFSLVTQKPRLIMRKTLDRHMREYLQMSASSKQQKPEKLSHIMTPEERTACTMKTC